LQSIAPESEFTTIKSKSGKVKTYTDLLINVNFGLEEYCNLETPIELYEIIKGEVRKSQKKIYIDKKKKKNGIEEIRRTLFNEGVTLRIGDRVYHYTRAQRSASKSRIGSHLFIRDDFHDQMRHWSRLGLEFTDGEKADIASLKAYESLTSSGIESIINIAADEILIIDDYITLYSMQAAITKIIKNKMVSVDDNWVAENNIWDGQSLLDKSVFEKCGRQKSMMQLRSHFFKTAAFNTNIQAFFNDYYKKLGITKPTYLLDMYENKVDIEKIKIITTPSSLKILKFSEKYSGCGGDEAESLCYKKWLADMGGLFGVCKSETSSPYGNWHRTSYQMNNTLPLEECNIGMIKKDKKSKELKFYGLLRHQMEELVKLNNDPVFFCNYIKPTDKNSEENPVDRFYYDILRANPNLWNTDFYKQFVSDKTDYYKNNIKRGRIMIENSDYATLLGCPVEMLYAAVLGSRFEDMAKKIERPLTGSMIYCSKYDDGTELTCFRNPHVCSGNILVATNTHSDDLKKYFNLSENIVVIDSWDSDVLVRLQGADQDGDTIAIFDNPCILHKAKEVSHLRVPVNGIKGTQTPRYYTVDDEVAVDYTISQNLIGKIINLSQVFNSYYWEEKDEEKRKQIYEYVCSLSSLSQIELDRAKKDFDLDIARYLGRIKNATYKGTNERINRYDYRLPKTFTIGKKEKYNKYCTDRHNLVETKKELENQLIRTRSRSTRQPLKQKIQNIKDQINILDNKVLFELGSKVPERPNFFQLCGKSENFAFRHFDTPMDFLFRIIGDKRLRRKSKTSDDIADVIREPNLDKQSKRNTDELLELCHGLLNQIRKLNCIKEGSKLWEDIKEEYDDAIRKIREKSFDANTIRIIIFRALSNKKQVYKKYRNYKRMRRNLLTVLYHAHPDVFIKAIT
jgi:hypothetical protein